MEQTVDRYPRLLGGSPFYFSDHDSIGDRNQARFPRTDFLSTGAGGRGGETVYVDQVPFHATGRRGGERTGLGIRRRSPRHPRRTDHSEASVRRASADFECSERGDELRRTPARAPLLRRAAFGADPLLFAPFCGEAGGDRLGPDLLSLRRLGGGCPREVKVRPLLHQEHVALLRSLDHLSDGEDRSLWKRGEVRGKWKDRFQPSAVSAQVNIHKRF